MLSALQSEIEIQHILIELKNSRTQHMRHFIDQYYCYQNGYITNNKADWKKIFWSKYVSEGAQQLQTRDSSSVIKEHVVPLKIIVKILDRLPKDNLDPTQIKTILNRLVVFATITKQEDALLSKSGLKSKMPFKDESFESVSSDLFARYNHVGIKIIDTQGPQILCPTEIVPK